MFCSKMVSAAPSGLPVAIWRMNNGMSMVVGQAVNAGRVVAEIAPVGLDPRLVQGQRGVQVGKVLGVAVRFEPSRNDAVSQTGRRHGVSSPMPSRGKR
jgi:hypothetical protein